MVQWSVYACRPPFENKRHDNLPTPNLPRELIELGNSVAGKTVNIDGSSRNPKKVLAAKQDANWHRIKMTAMRTMMAEHAAKRARDPGNAQRNWEGAGCGNCTIRQCRRRRPNTTSKPYRKLRNPGRISVGNFFAWHNSVRVQSSSKLNTL